MRMTGITAGLLLIALGSASAWAQATTADLPYNRGGVGVGRHGTGFDGTMGDPDLFPASAATLVRLGYAPPYRVPGTEYGVPPSSGFGYTPNGRPPMQYEIRTPAAR